MNPLRAISPNSLFPLKSAALLAVFVVFQPSALARDLPDFTNMVEKNAPAVVNISTTQKTKHPAIPQRHFKNPNPEEIPEGPFGDLFRRFFGDPGEGGGDPDIEDFDAKSLGSGFVISKDGYVLTNNHVIKDANEIIVRFNDRREAKAKLVGKDERSDIALLKVEEKNLPTVEIGKSSDLKVGEWVLAIGSPFGFDHSVTAGIVSAKGRPLPRENYVPFIQTDVAINPGNSGGPLFNLDGEVVGINSQIYSRTGGFMGLSFAIPIDIAMNVVEQLKKSGHVARGWLGVLIQEVNPELAESFKMEKPSGALVTKILPNSPAAKTGFQIGDIVTKFDGRPILRFSNLPPIVGMTPVGKDVDVEVLRKGKVVTLTIRLGELPDDEVALAARSDAEPPASPANRLNVIVTDLTDELRQQMDLKDGVMVKDLEEGAAKKAGVRRGDVILMINNVEIKDVNQFNKVIKELPADKSVPLLVQRRRGGPEFLALKVDKVDKVDKK